MKKIATILLMLIGMGIHLQAGHLANYDIVPLPQSITMQKGEPFVLDGKVMILADTGLQQEAVFLQQARQLVYSMASRLCVRL